MRAVVLAAIACTACLRQTQFHCDDNTDCPGGTCEPIGFCSFADSACASGARFGELAGGLSNTCVGGGPGLDGGVDGPPDGSPDAPPDAAICPGYAPIAGAPNRYRLEASSASWDSHKASCAADGGYLFIPNDAAELAAVAGADADHVFWVGLTDAQTEGTFLTVLGAPAPFLPWAAGEPNNQPNPQADCVRAVSTTTIADDRCSTGHDAICECGPP